MPVPNEGFRRDAVSLTMVTLLMAGLAVIGTVGRATGVGLIALLVGYTAYAYFSERRSYRAAAAAHEMSVKEVMPPAMGIPAGLVVTVSGIVAVVFGARTCWSVPPSRLPGRRRCRRR